MRKGSRRRRQLHKKKNLAMRFAGVLLLLVGVSTWMLTGMLARYTAAGRGNDYARIAGFDVKVTVAPTNQTIAADENDTVIASYDILVENASEVAVRYSIFITFEEALPEWIEVKLTDDLEADKVSPDGKTFYYNNIDDLMLGASADETMTITLDGEQLALSASDPDGGYSMSYEKTIDFEVYVSVEQID